MFPDAQFVHLIRDRRDAVGSLRSMPWYGGDLYTAALTWREAIDTDRVGTWNDRFESWELRLVESVLTAGLSDHGYALSSAPRPTAAQLARFDRTAARRWRNQRRHATSDRLRSKREPNPVESLLSTRPRAASTANSSRTPAPTKLPDQ